MMIPSRLWSEHHTVATLPPDLLQFVEDSLSASSGANSWLARTEACVSPRSESLLLKLDGLVAHYVEGLVSNICS